MTMTSILWDKGFYSTDTRYKKEKSMQKQVNNLASRGISNILITLRNRKITLVNKYHPRRTREKETRRNRKNTKTNDKLNKRC